MISKTQPQPVNASLPVPSTIALLKETETVTRMSSVDSSGIVDTLAKVWGKILGIDVVRTDSNFFDIGGHRRVFDLILRDKRYPELVAPSSLLVPQLLREINKEWSGLDISLVSLFHQASLEKQASMIARTISTSNNLSEGDATMSPPSHLSSPTATTGKIAIIGLSGRFPGATDADSFFQLLLEKRDGIKTFPPESSSKFKIPDGAKHVPRRGVIDDVEAFDHEMWNLTKEEATDMDPQQRVFLDVVLSALEDAGLDPFQSMQNRNRTGLYVGAATNTYHTITQATFGDAFTRANRALVAPSISALTAYHLNLQGPNITLNVNCASSTAALSVAVDHLTAGFCDTAVAGGVAIFFPQSVVLFDCDW